jgi:two-component system CheB/CheR fusion protein
MQLDPPPHNDNEPSLATSEAPPAPSSGLSVVGLGASAGGLAALQSFFRHMPADSGMAFVVILHLSPEYHSQLAELLQRETAMPVLQVTEAVPLDRNRVYVIPPAHNLTLVDGTLQLSDVAEPRGQRAPIDLFFRSLAATHGPRAAAVVLSGTGADGAMGVKRIKEDGGLVLVQDPAEAEYEMMPRHAIATGLVDFVLPVAEMPARLTAGWHQPQTAVVAEHPPLSDKQNDTALRDLLSTLRARTGHDFSQYKRPTLLRRIARRMQVTGTTTLPAYLALLRARPEEGAALLRDLLISVTNFFRDPPAWRALEAAIPLLFAGKDASGLVRAWVVGCATGEEAYSVAMLLYEHAMALEYRPNIQVFATDIDEHAIGVARVGLYPDTIAVDVSPERLQRFFTSEPGAYRVRKELRDLVLFAPHNVLRDPPFSRLDLITCRNLLIYIDRAMQEQILQLFHFTLQPDRLLMLGNSESTDGVPALFAPIDKAHQLFRRRTVPGAPPLVPAMPLLSPPHRQSLRGLQGGELPSPSFNELDTQALAQYGPPSVIVNEDYDIVHLARGAGRFLQFPDGTPSPNLLKALHPDLRLELRTALYQALQEGLRTESRQVRLSLGGVARQVSVAAQPMTEPAWARGHVLILFHDTPDSGDGVADGASAAEPLVRQLEAELQRTRDQLRTTSEQYETAIEEHKAGNEELQALNEELRATTEELETSKEELQSINEELQTVNQELKHKVEEVSQSHSDLQNLMMSTAIGTIFVDRELRIKRYTPSAQTIVNLIPSDINRPLAHITHQMDYDQLIPDALRVLNTLTPFEREVASKDSCWHLLRIQPYRTETDQIDGVVLTFVDITQRRAAEEALRASEERLRLLIESVQDYAILTVTPDNQVVYWNTGAERMFGYSEAEIVGRDGALLFTPEDRAAGAHAQEIQQALTNGRAEDERWHIRKDGSRFYASGVMTPMRDTAIRGFAKVMRDLTDRKQDEEALRRAHDALEQRIVERTQALATTNAQLQAEAAQRRAAERERQEVLRQLMTAQEDVQRHIARELHDQFGQSTAALRLWAAQLSAAKDDPQQLAERVVQLQTIVAQLDDDIRRLARELRPRALDVVGLVPALQEHLALWSRQTGMSAQLAVIGDMQATLPAEITTVVYRAMQEALTNVLKHADARDVNVVLQQQADQVQLTIEDNGVGMPSGPATAGLGLMGMRERIELVGGTLEIETVASQGTTLFVRIPLAGGQAPDADAPPSR